MPDAVATILVLDDDPGIVTLERRVLERAGHKVVATTSVDEAIEHVRRGVDLAVLDYQLSGRTTGFELYQKIRAEGFDVPAILVTGFSDERRVIDALRAGFRDVIPKLEGYLDHLPLSAERVIKQERAERALAETDAVRRSEERLRLALEAGRMASWDRDLRTGEVEWSPMMLQLLGLTPDNTATNAEIFDSCIHPDDREMVRTRVLHCVESCEDYAAVYRVVWPDQSVHWLDARGRCQLDKAGRPLRMHGVAADVTERKTAEDELLRARARAEDASRAKDQFLAVLSHELRTPLTPVLAAVQLLEDEPAMVGSALEMIRLVRRNVELEARLIDDLLDLTRIVRGKVELQMQRVDAHEGLRHVLTTFAADFAAKQITVGQSFAASRSSVMADPARLQQVYWNLVKNALKFTPAGGRVDVDTADTAEGLQVAIRDSGIGIDPAVLSRLFEPFEQGGREITRRFGGLGLGLSISHGLAVRHHGTLTAASDGLGRGATFTLTLPTAHYAAPDEAAPAAPAAVAAPACPNLRALLVEDHEDTREMMARLLGQFGLTVATASSVATAIAHADTAPFDLLISDIGLPDGTGLDVIRELRRRGPVHGIVMSGFGMDEDVRRSLEAGFAEHLTKPVSAERLRAAVTRLSQSVVAAK